MADILDNFEAAQPGVSNIEELLRVKSGKTKTTTAPAASDLASETAKITGEVQGRQLSLLDRMGRAQTAAGESELASQLRTRIRERAAATERADVERVGQYREQAAQRDAEESMARKSRESQTSTQINQINSTADGKLADIVSASNTEIANLFSGHERGQRELEARADQASLEQKAFLLAMADEAYLEEITRVGDFNQLRDQLKYNEEVNRIVMGNDMKNVLDDIAFKTSENATQREFERNLVKIRGEVSLQAGKALINDMQTKLFWQGIGSIPRAAVHVMEASEARDRLERENEETLGWEG